jgi:hypothetical protein
MPPHPISPIAIGLIGFYLLKLAGGVGLIRTAST